MSETLNCHLHATVHRKAATSNSSELLTTSCCSLKNCMVITQMVQELFLWQTDTHTPTTDTVESMPPSLHYRCVTGY